MKIQVHHFRLRFPVFLIPLSFLLLLQIPSIAGGQELQRGYVTGRVVDGEGRPIAGAELILEMFDRPPQVQKRWNPTVSDDEGFFSVAIPSITTFHLWIQAKGHESRSLDLGSLRPWSNREIGPVGMAARDEKEGRVRFSFLDKTGGVWAGKRLRCHLSRKDMHWRADADLVTDDHGETVETKLAAGMWTAAIFPEGAKALGKVEFTIVPGRETHREITLEPCCTVSGRVFDHEGNPVTWAQVGIEGKLRKKEKVSGGYHEVEYFSGRCTMERGEYRLVVPPGKQRILAWILGCELGSSAEFEAVEGEESRDVDVRLTPVETRDDLGILKVSLSKPDPIFVGRPFGSCKIKCSRTGKESSGWEHPDSRGDYWFYWCEPGQYTIEIDAGLRFQAPEMKVRVKKGGITEVSYQHGLPCAIEGRVFTPSGEPAGAVKVSIPREEYPAPEVEVSDRGEFHAGGLKAGSYDVWFFEKGTGWYRLKDLSLKPSDGTPLRIMLTPWHSVRGRVVDENGLPLEGALVSVKEDHELEPGHHPNFDAIQKNSVYEKLFGFSHGLFDAVGETRSGPDGSFHLTNLLDVKHRVYTRREEFFGGGTKFDFSGKTDSFLPDIVLKREFDGFGRLRITVVDDGGTPIHGARVKVEVEGKLPHETNTDEDGRAIFESIPAGLEGKVEVKKEEFAPDVGETWRLSRDRTLEVRFVLNTGGKIEGAVLDRNGRPREGQEVILHGGKAEKWYTVFTDGEGRFRVEQLAPGRYSVSASEKNPDWRLRGEERARWYQRVAVNVVRGQSTRVDFHMADVGSLVGRIDLGNCPLPHDRRHMYLDFHGIGGGERSCRLAGDGSFRIEGLAPAKYTLRLWLGKWVISSHSYPQDGIFLQYRRMTAEVKVGEITRFEGALEKGGSIRGRVLLKDSDAEIGRVMVYADGSKVKCQLWTDTGGNFFFPYLPPGEYELWAVKGGGWRKRLPVRVKAGETVEGVSLKVDGR